MAKPMMLIRAPVGTRSGYGDMSRDVVRHLINLDKWDVHVMSCPWGHTPMNALSQENPKDVPIIDRLMTQPNLPRQPEIFISITVPNEWQPLGKYNVGITAGIETTACSPEWVQGMNRMDLVLTISEHSKQVLQSSAYQEHDQKTNVKTSLRLTKPIEVLHNCVDVDIFKKIKAAECDPMVNDLMVDVKEKFGFLFVGHWLQGPVGHDRKDVGMLVKVFLETFRRIPKKDRPALILKTSGAGFSVLDREDILNKIEHIRSEFSTKNLPSVYLLHGNLTESEMNSLYNHPKIKAHISFTKGEGFGRPLLEASMSGKPIIVSGWSGHLDFLNPTDAVLLSGNLHEVGQGAAWQGVINADTSWFKVDYQNAANIMHHVWKHYKQFQSRGRPLMTKNFERFNPDAIQKRTGELMDQYLPEFKVAEAVSLELPELPTLKKIKVGGKKAPKDVPSEAGEKVSMNIADDVLGATVEGVQRAQGDVTSPSEPLQQAGVEING
jgi:glycosyltransferase involved in cell wall biosynthesis